MSYSRGLALHFEQGQVWRQPGQMNKPESLRSMNSLFGKILSKSFECERVVTLPSFFDVKTSLLTLFDESHYNYIKYFITYNSIFLKACIAE